MDERMAPTEEERRVATYYAGFPASRDVNPHQWDAKVAHWRARIVEDCAAGRLGDGALSANGTPASPAAVSFDASRLSEHFRLGALVPLGLDVVLGSMAAAGDVVRDDELSATVSAQSTWGAWFVHKLVRKPLSWAVSQVSRPTVLCGRYVVLELLEAAAKATLERHSATATQSSDNIVPMGRFVAMTELSRLDAEFVLQYLVASRRVAVFSLENGDKFLKIGPAGAPVATPSDVDRGVAQLDSAIALVQSQVDRMQGDADRLRKAAAQASIASKKEIALHNLRRSKAIERAIDGRLSILSNLTDVLTRIQSSETDAKALEALSCGAKALKLSTASSEKVEHVMAQVEDAFDRQEESEDAMRAGMSLVTGTDDAAIEAELAALCEAQESAAPARADNLATATADELSKAVGALSLASSSPAKPQQSVHDILKRAPEVPNVSPRRAEPAGEAAEEASRLVTELALT